MKAEGMCERLSMHPVSVNLLMSGQQCVGVRVVGIPLATRGIVTKIYKWRSFMHSSNTGLSFSYSYPYNIISGFHQIGVSKLVSSDYIGEDIVHILQYSGIDYRRLYQIPLSITYDANSVISKDLIKGYMCLINPQGANVQDVSGLTTGLYAKHVSKDLVFLGDANVNYCYIPNSLQRVVTKGVLTSTERVVQLYDVKRVLLRFENYLDYKSVMLGVNLCIDLNTGIINTTVSDIRNSVYRSVVKLFNTEVFEWQTHSVFKQRVLGIQK